MITDVTIQVEDPDHVTTRPWQGFDSFRHHRRDLSLQGRPPRRRAPARRAVARRGVALLAVASSAWSRGRRSGTDDPEPGVEPAQPGPADGHARRQPDRVGEDLRRRTTPASSTRTSATTWRPGSAPTSRATCSPASSGCPSSDPTGPARRAFRHAYSDRPRRRSPGRGRRAPARTRRRSRSRSDRACRPRHRADRPPRIVPSATWSAPAEVTAQVHQPPKGRSASAATSRSARTTSTSSRRSPPATSLGQGVPVDQLIGYRWDAGDRRLRTDPVPGRRAGDPLPVEQRVRVLRLQLE